MNKTILYPAGNTAALRYACQELSDRGVEVVSVPTSNVTHLILPVPSFEANGEIKGGGVLEDILADLPQDVTVIGGNLKHPALHNYKTIDLLQDPIYVSENAAITADCAIRIAGNNLPLVFKDCPILIIGWGRIGKCLAAQLKALDAKVTVAARKETDRGILKALGYEVRDPAKFGHCLMRYRVIFNTAPVPVISEEQAVYCRDDCLKIELASVLGIAGKDVIWARGLPGKDAPESSGALIAKTTLRLIAGKEAFI